MTLTRVAKRYAKALLSLAKEQGIADVLHNDMKQMAIAIDENKELLDMLQNPVIPSSVKKTTLLSVFENTNALSVNLIDTLEINKRLAVLGDVAYAYNTLYFESENIETAYVTTATPLDDGLRTKVLSKIKELTGKKVVINSQIDPSIIGGFILRIGDLQYNSSIAYKLTKLKREFSLN